MPVCVNRIASNDSRASSSARENVPLSQRTRNVTLAFFFVSLFFILSVAPYMVMTTIQGWMDQPKTRRERLKSALYLRLKKRKRLFLNFLKEIFEFFSFRKCRIVPKNVKGGTLWALLTYILLQNIKKLERGTLLIR